MFTETENRYVTQMAAYIFHEEGALPNFGPEQWVASFMHSEALKSGKASFEHKQTRLVYYLALKAGRVITPEDWMMLRCDRSN